MDKPPRIHRKRGRSRIQHRTACQKSSHTKSVTIWCLPQEVLLHLVQNLHIKELLNLNCTHPYFRDLITNNPSVWQTVSFHGMWPTIPNMKHFMRAAEHGNIEALVKLGVAFLYNEGLPGDFEGKKITTNGERAAEMFCKVEVSTPLVSPFTWLFIRPPWAVSGACCKECVFNNMKDFVSHTPDASIHICIAKIMGILGVDEYKDGIAEHLTLAKNLGSSEAAFLLWTYKYCQCCRVLDCASNLEGLRDLRQIAMSGYYEAQLALSKRYVGGKFGGISKKSATEFVKNFIQSSQPTHVKEIYRFNELTHSMRYILMDWLVEVACMKDFSSLTLHMAISVVDRFLLKHKTTRAKLQLLGVAAMVLCSRVLGTEIITIREAAWLTDNTYKYEDVVRMMGEITATLGGKFRVPVSLDYVSLLTAATGVDSETTYLAEYFCELALLQSALGDFSRAQVAAACVLLARIIMKHENPWPAKMIEFTGFRGGDLNKCILLLHDKCFLDQAMVDHRDVVLQAVKERFADEDFMFVSNIKMMSKVDLSTLLGLSSEEISSFSTPSDSAKSPNKDRVHSPKDLIASPCRGGSSRITIEECVAMETEREQAATPTLQAMKRGASRMNESVSGYDGDREDEGESFLEQEAGYDSDPDGEIDNLWCTDYHWEESHSHVDMSSADEDCSFYGPVPLVPSKKPAECNTKQQASSPQLVGSMSVPVTSFTFGGVSPLRLGATLSSPDPSSSAGGLWKTTLKSLTESQRPCVNNILCQSIATHQDSKFSTCLPPCDIETDKTSSAHQTVLQTATATVTSASLQEASPYCTRSFTKLQHSLAAEHTCEGSPTQDSVNSEVNCNRRSRKRKHSGNHELGHDSKIRVIQLQDK